MNPTQRNQIEQMLARATHLQYFGSLHPKVVEDLKLMLGQADPASEAAKNFAELMKRAHQGDLDARSEMRALVITTTVNYLVATMNFGRFFSQSNLADNESPVVQNNTRQQITIDYISQEGKPRQHKMVKPQTETHVDLSILSSEVVTYTLRDLYTGDVSGAAAATFDIAHDLRGKLEDVLKVLLDTKVGAFDVTAANKSARVYNAESRFLSGVLPTTNSLSITGITGATTFGLLTVATEIVDYCSRFAGTDPTGDLRPTGELIVPAQDVRDVLSSITLTSAAQNAASQEILARGWLDLPPVLGVNWRIISDNTIARDACYAVLNKPVGLLWFKPGFSEVDEQVNKVKNRAERTESLAYGAAIPTPNARNFVKVAYQT